MECTQINIKKTVIRNVVEKLTGEPLSEHWEVWLEGLTSEDIHAIIASHMAKRIME